MTKIQKTSIQSAAARAAIARAADELERYDSDPSVAGLVSKLRASIAGAVVPADGSGLPTAFHDRQVTKAERRFEEAMTDMVALRTRDDLPPQVREAVLKASRNLGREYLHKVSPAAAAAMEGYEVQRQAATAGAPRVSCIGDESEIRKAAKRLRKSDPALSEYDALELAYKAERAALAS